MSTNPDSVPVDGPHPAAGTAARRARREAARRPSTAPARRPPPAGSTGAARRALDPDALAALEDERDFLLRSLRDLEREHEAGDVDDHDHAALQDDYTARAAAVLRSIETRQAALAAHRASSPHPTRRLVIAALVALFAVIAGALVAQSSGRRGAGDEITGDIRQTARDRLFEARQAMGERRFVDAIGIFDDVVRMSPSNVEAHAYKGWLLVITARQTPAGDDQNLLRSRALAELDQAVELDPHYADARVFRAAAYGDVGRPEAGLADLAELQPGDVPLELGGLVDSLRERLRQQAADPSVSPGTAAPG